MAGHAVTAGLILILYFLTSALTETVTNNAVAVIMTPVAPAGVLQADPVH
jgi:di/tricarboxylate transporter